MSEKLLVIVYKQLPFTKSLLDEYHCMFLTKRTGKSDSNPPSPIIATIQLPKN